jgi:hypothetical protein
MKNKKRRNVNREEKREVQTGGGAYVGGNVITGGGDFVGRDKVIADSESNEVNGTDLSYSTITLGSGNVVTNLQNIFASIFDAIENSYMPPRDKEAVFADVRKLETEAKKGDSADESFLAQRLRTLRHMAPDISELLLSALAGPGAVVSTLVKKVAEKVKAEA